MAKRNSGSMNAGGVNGSRFSILTEGLDGSGVDGNTHDMADSDNLSNHSLISANQGEKRASILSKKAANTVKEGQVKGLNYKTYPCQNIQQKGDFNNSKELVVVRKQGVGIVGPSTARRIIQSKAKPTSHNTPLNQEHKSDPPTNHVGLMGDVETSADTESGLLDGSDAIMDDQVSNGIGSREGDFHELYDHDADMNVQWAGSQVFLNTLKDLIRVHSPAILVLLETHIVVCECIGYDGLIRTEAIGFRRGIWILWRASWLVLQQFIIVTTNRIGEPTWILSAIYACPEPQTREFLWLKLLEFSANNALPWLLIGDFNETCSLEERTEQSENMSRRCEKFQEWINQLELLDLGFSGQKFTWSREMDESIRTSARLDMGLCNTQWQTMFENAAIKHLAANQSDHTPLLMSIQGFVANEARSKPFWFNVAWQLHIEFQSFLANHWDKGASLSSTLASFALHLDSRNKEIFGDMFSRQDRICRRIDGV
ncbi:hypothetical protein V2J09_006777 [Rumex salicifolius]